MPTTLITTSADEQLVYRIKSPELPKTAESFRNARINSEYLRHLTVRERLDACLRIQQYILEHREEIISRIVEETGKARFDALVSEIHGVLDLISYYDKHAEEILSDRKVPASMALMGKKSKVFFEPLGVVLVISSWSYPFYQAMAPCLSAFIAGNAVICKPSEVAPLQGIIEEIFQKSGVIENAVQVVYGGAEAGEELISNEPDKIVLSGSVETGREIMRLASEHLIPVDLELHGKDAMIVFDDANLEKAASAAIWGGLTNCGQSHSSVQRIYVQEGISRRFVELLKKKASRLVVARNGKDVNWSQIDVGPLTLPSLAEKVRRNVVQAVAGGARIQYGGGTESVTEYPPTILTDVDHTMKIMREETFAPVLPVMKFTSQQEVIRLANDSEYGLGASIWSGDLKRAEQVARQLRVGNVCINNVMLNGANPALPFGGVKQSGFGRCKGAPGLHSFANVKSVMIDKSKTRPEAHWFPYTREKYLLFSRLIDSLYSRTWSIVRFIRIRWGLERLAEKQEP
jgi:acyl-CoA reductase-like NAD-dependent aldehyde dehydrogenase